MLPRLSCLMATHGRHQFVRSAVSCFLSQTYPEKELVILNNHPVPLEYRGSEMIRIFNEPKYATLGACRNRLLELATGEFIRTWDDDDLYLPWSLAQGMAHIGEAAAFKPKRSWFQQGGQGYRLEENVFEAAMLIRTEIARKYGYQETGGDEHHPLLIGLRDEGGEVQRELGIWTAYCYRWGIGATHISGSLGRGTLEARTAAWKEANQNITSPRIEPLDLSGQWREMASYCGTDREEWFSRTTGAAKEEFVHPNQVLDQIERRWFSDFDGRPLSVVEVCSEACTRSAVERQKRSTDRPRNFQLMEERPGTLEVSPTLSGESLRKPWSALEERNFDFSPIDLLWLSCPDDPLKVLDLLRKLLPSIHEQSVLCVDRSGSVDPTLLVREFLISTHQELFFGSHAIYVRRPIPAWYRWPPYS